MSVNNTQVPSGTNLATPPSSPEKGVVEAQEKTPKKAQEKDPKKNEENSSPKVDSDAVKPASKCTPSAQRPDWVLKGLIPSSGPTSLYKAMDPNRFLEDRAPGELHQWPPRPNVVNTVATLEHDMRIAIIPEIQLPIAFFHVYANGTLKIEGRFAREIFRIGITGRYNKRSTSFGEKLARLRRLVRERRRKAKKPKDGKVEYRDRVRDRIRDKVKEMVFRSAMEKWESEGSSKRPVLSRVSTPRQRFAFVRGTRVPQERVHFPELNVPEVVVDGDDVLWKEDSILIQRNSGRKILANATLFVPEDWKLFRDCEKLGARISLSEEEEAVMDESTLSEVDIVKYQLSRGRWMWIYHTNRLHDPDINAGLTEDYELARYYDILKNDQSLLQKLCSGIPFTRNDRIMLHSYGIEKFHVTPLLKYASILAAKDENYYSPIQPGIEIDVPSTAQINCVQESRITQTLLGKTPVKPPPPISYIAIPEDKSIKTLPSERENSLPVELSTKPTKGKEKEKIPNALSKLSDRITALLKFQLKEPKGKQPVRPQTGLTYHRRPNRRPRPILRGHPPSKVKKARRFGGRPAKPRTAKPPHPTGTPRTAKSSPLKPLNRTTTVPAPEFLNMCPPCSQYASGSQHSPIDCVRMFRPVDWGRYPDPMESDEESESVSESVRRLLGMRPQIRVERCVFVGVRGGSLIGDEREGVEEGSGGEVRKGERLEGWTETVVKAGKMERGGRTGGSVNKRFEGGKSSSSPSNPRPAPSLPANKNSSSNQKAIAKPRPKVHFAPVPRGKRLPVDSKRRISV
ncbi:hypothetical protein HYALB_00005321 [Hymenoscyphus albidus]|uniref:Uncharacterized protein n=1 Tax=Hymenoscyphus albidus TaxID=595503 RepID=A0A9N9Q740_9HELO|nr:hypothetical protein HYALB_00005321 [Hymenoscyphus albidus]